VIQTQFGYFCRFSYIQCQSCHPLKMEITQLIWLMMITFENLDRPASIQSKSYANSWKCIHRENYKNKHTHIYVVRDNTWTKILPNTELECSQSMFSEYRKGSGGGTFMSFKSIWTFPSHNIQIMWELWVLSTGNVNTVIFWVVMPCNIVVSLSMLFHYAMNCIDYTLPVTDGWMNEYRAMVQ
jgi:hypothetical protein